MSWSVAAKGKPAEIRESLAQQFVSAKSSTVSVAAENQAVGLAEQIVGLALDHANPDTVVCVSGWGSANNEAIEKNEAGQPLWKAAFSFNLAI